MVTRLLSALLDPLLRRKKRTVIILLRRGRSGA